MCDFYRGQKNSLLFGEKLGDGDNNNYYYLLIASVCDLFYKQCLLLILKLP